MKKYIALCGIIAALIGAQFVSARIYNPPSAGLSALTPWTSNIDAGGYSLTGLLNASSTGSITATNFYGKLIGTASTTAETVSGPLFVTGISTLASTTVANTFQVATTTVSENQVTVQATGTKDAIEIYNAAVSPAFIVKNDGSVGVATSTITENQLSIQASSTKDILEGYDNAGLSKFLFKRTGGISTCESVLATSTSMTIDWTLCPTQIARLSTAAVTIAVSNNQVAGQSITLETCAPPSGTMGAITFTGVDWANQTVPTQTTTANNCDLWGFKPITATSTLVIHGAQTPKF